MRPLIEAARSGDPRARNALAGCLERFLRLFSGTLTRQVRRAQGSTLDFVNEGLAEALARLGEFEYRTDEEFYAWVGRLIRSRMVDAIRREARKKRDGKPAAIEGGSAGPAARGPTPSEAVSAAEVRDVVRRALLELQVDHPQEMEVVLLKVFEDESWRSIQETLGLSSMKRARTLCARGLDLLRPRIEESLGPTAFEEYLGL
ncbi:MAG: sigma-70 family RNA polymerase sigma factor [Planctomycetes bacterium]|nr:sigma-70 family RNA polymerase sigma factor [Planctomycetota bacterium]